MMMKLSIIALAVCCALQHNSFGQQSTMGTLAGKQVDVKTGSGTVLTQLPMAPPKTNGDVYLESDWTLADISLTGEGATLEGYPIKLDLETNSLEIQYMGQVKILPGVRVNHFILNRNNGVKEKYINGRNYFLNNTPVGGFLHVVDSGKWMLLVKKELKVVEATYNPALHVGNRDNELVKDEKSFLCKDNMLYELDMPMRKFARQFIGHETVVAEFLKEERINLKKAADISKLLVFLNHAI